MYLIVDNYDSFTYNLYQLASELTDRPFTVVRNDKITVEEVEEMAPEGIVISPGPGRPEEAGISVELVRRLAGKTPILGVCLGHQVVGAAFGAKITTARRIVHGKVEDMHLDGKGLFRHVPSPSRFTRYHSLVVDRDTVPAELEVTATSTDGEIMGLRHKALPVEGIQFHPESVASEHGKRILGNFLHYRREAAVVGPLLARLMGGDSLSFGEAQAVMDELTDGNLNNSQIAALLACLNVRGVVPDEIAGFAAVLRAKRVPFRTSRPVLDTCGTGGDGLGTFNISSMAALVAASCGVAVAKHGNRGVSSRSGSADFYRSLGVPIDLAPEKASALLGRTGFAFLYAPLYHGAMRHAAAVRKELAVKTVMNLLGPLANPAEAQFQLIGVYAEELCRPVAEAARLLGIHRVMVAHGRDGMDEISVAGPTRIVEIDQDGRTRDYLFDPAELGIPKYETRDLAGGSPEENAREGERLLAGGGSEAVRQAVLLNAGAALAVAGAAGSIAEGYRAAKKALKNGDVERKVRQVIEEASKLDRAEPANGAAAAGERVGMAHAARIEGEAHLRTGASA